MLNHNLSGRGAHILCALVSSFCLIATSACDPINPCPVGEYRPGPPRSCVLPDGGEIVIDDGGPAADGGSSSDACVPRLFYADDDMDGYGDPATSRLACAQPPGFVADSSDCNDECRDCNPGGTEVCDPARLDENCSGGGNEGCECTAGAAPRPCPGGVETGECTAGVQMCVAGAWAACEGGVGPMMETCNGRDDDCDSVIDGPAAAASCTPGPHTTASTCASGACQTLTCESGWDDCDDDFATGCEARLTTLSDCGACGVTCGWACGGTACGDATQVESGGAFSCALLGGGRVSCWGYGSEGQMGIGATTSVNPMPRYVQRSDGLGVLENVIDLAVGYEFACAVVTGGQVYCWGANSRGQLGNGTTTRSTLPTLVVTSIGGPALTSITDVSAGRFHACARNSAGRALCWGANTFGQLGNNSTTQSTTPIVAQTLGTSTALSSIAAVELGSSHSCARTSAGTVYCWGANASGQLGDGSTMVRGGGVQVLGPSGSGSLSAVAELSCGDDFSCARSSDGSIRCWGANALGQLGRTGASSTLPISVLTDVDGTLSATRLWAGAQGACALAADGLRCWGSNTGGRLGLGVFAASVNRATRVLGLAGAGSVLGVVSAVGPGEDHTCAVIATGAMVCWGTNENGQVAVVASGRYDPLLATPPIP